MSAILFFDPACDRPYDSQTLRREALGGTEATVARVADALEALVVQHNRTGASGRYLPPRGDRAITHVIVIRDSRALPRVRELYPNARSPVAARSGEAAIQARAENRRGRRHPA